MQDSFAITGLSHIRSKGRWRLFASKDAPRQPNRVGPEERNALWMTRSSMLRVYLQIHTYPDTGDKDPTRNILFARGSAAAYVYAANSVTWSQRRNCRGSATAYFYAANSVTRSQRRNFRGSGWCVIFSLRWRITPTHWTGGRVGQPPCK